MAGRVKRFRAPSELASLVSPVVGQEDMKRKLVSAFSQYTLSLDDRSVKRPLVLVVGPSGTGKTMAVELLSKSVKLPYSIFSAASISPPGYRGTTVKDMMQSFLVQRIQRKEPKQGVIVVDEIDKWTQGALGSGAATEATASGLHCQSELLRYVERERVVFTDEAKDDERLEDQVLETDRLLWILLGAFTGIEAKVQSRLHNYNLELEDCLHHLLPEDAIAYGMLGELANRVNTWAWTIPLKRTQLREILRDQEVPLWVKRFGALGCELEVDEGALGRCADLAYDLHTGARGAQAMFRRSMDDLYYEASMHNLGHLRVDVGTVVTGRLPDALSA